MDSKLKIKLLVALCLSIFLIQFLFDRSLYIDEAALGLNLQSRDYLGLLQPLSSFQVTPILFLLSSEFLTNILGFSTLTIRLLPFLFGVVSIIFIYPMSYRLTGSFKISLTCLFLLGFSPLFMRYSTEFKQYAVDLCLTILFLWYVFKEEKVSLSSTIAGCISIFLSHISIFLLFIYGLKLLIRKQELKSLIRLFLSGAAWVICFFFYYSEFIVSHPSKQHQVDFWQYAFMPMNPIELITWFPTRFFTIFYNFFAYNVYLIPSVKYKLILLPFIFFLIFLIGIYSLIKNKQYKLIYYTLSPIALHLILSSLEIYPYSVRNTYYQLPIYLLLFSVGINHISTLKFWSLKLKKYLLPVFISTYMLLFIINYPFTLEKVKTTIEYVVSNKKENQGIYIFKDIRGIYKYYKNARLLSDDKSVIIGNVNISNLKDLDQDLTKIRSKETWFIFGNENQLNTRKGRFDFNSKVMDGSQFLETDKSYILDYIRRNNYEVRDSIIYKGSSAYLIIKN